MVKFFKLLPEIIKLLFVLAISGLRFYFQKRKAVKSFQQELARKDIDEKTAEKLIQDYKEIASLSKLKSM